MSGIITSISLPTPESQTLFQSQPIDRNASNSNKPTSIISPDVPSSKGTIAPHSQWHSETPVQREPHSSWPSASVSLLVSSSSTSSSTSRTVARLLLPLNLLLLRPRPPTVDGPATAASSITSWYSPFLPRRIIFSNPHALRLGGPRRSTQQRERISSNSFSKLSFSFLLAASSPLPATTHGACIPEVSELKMLEINVAFPLVLVGKGLVTTVVVEGTQEQFGTLLPRPKRKSFVLGPGNVNVLGGRTLLLVSHSVVAAPVNARTVVDQSRCEALVVLVVLVNLSDWASVLTARVPLGGGFVGPTRRCPGHPWSPMMIGGRGGWKRRHVGSLSTPVMSCVGDRQLIKRWASPLARIVSHREIMTFPTNTWTQGIVAASRWVAGKGNATGEATLKLIVRLVGPQRWVDGGQVCIILPRRHDISLRRGVGVSWLRVHVVLLSWKVPILREGQ
ncbi:hypothetical protein KCU88_g414, partial [Aureobasidium melanogenum]